MHTGNMTMVYGAVAVLSVLILLGYLLWEKNKERNFIFLISCVAIVNTGYFLLAAARSLPMAMFANGMSYFGAASGGSHSLPGPGLRPLQHLPEGAGWQPSGFYRRDRSGAQEYRGQNCPRYS